MVSDIKTVDRQGDAQFDSDFKVEMIKPKAFRPPADWSHRGEMARNVLAIMRQASEPMTTRDLALEMLVTRALNSQDQRVLKLMTKRIAVALRYQRDNGTVRSMQGTGQFMVWEVAR